MLFFCSFPLFLYVFYGFPSFFPWEPPKIPPKYPQTPPKHALKHPQNNPKTNLKTLKHNVFNWSLGLISCSSCEVLSWDAGPIIFWSRLQITGCFCLKWAVSVSNHRVFLWGGGSDICTVFDEESEFDVENLEIPDPFVFSLLFECPFQCPFKTETPSAGHFLEKIPWRPFLSLLGCQISSRSRCECKTCFSLINEKISYTQVASWHHICS